MPSAKQDADGPLLLGRSHPIDELRRHIALAARTSAKVLVLGETGAGKDVVARLIHAQSARAPKPFVAVNCSGIPESLLESELFGHVQGSFTDAHRDRLGLVRQAEGGTLFLDEVGEMSARMQAVLLRFTETGHIQPVGLDTPVPPANVRIIAATNRDLRARVAEGAFREDLYYRLNVLTIHVPPLRDRGDDVLLLLKHLVKQAAQTFGRPCPSLSPDAEQLLVAYSWPGNVRELRNVTERLVAHCPSGTVTPDDLPADIRESLRLDASGATRFVRQPVTPPLTSLPGRDQVQELWDRLVSGESFWDVVHSAFMGRELARTELAALIDRGLQATNGSYQRLVPLFNMPPEDYKRFHAFLYQQRCNLPVAPYRMARAGRKSARGGEATGTRRNASKPAN
jgi:DNA-binding NtrC family response regulator